jgi:hypothetical protein
MLLLAELFPESIPRHLFWLEAASAASKRERGFERVVRLAVIDFERGEEGNANVVFAAGRLLSKRKPRVFSPGFVRQMTQALEFYNCQLIACRKAVDNWTRVGIRLKVVKDVRKLIAELIWNDRDSASFELGSNYFTNDDSDY